LDTTCCASCPKPKSKTNIRKKLANKTKQGMRQIWIHVHFFLLKNTQKTGGMRKKTAKEKGFESEMYVLALPHKLFKCLLLKPKTLCTLLLLLLSAKSPPYKSALSLFPKQTNNPKHCKSKCCRIKKLKNKYLKT
jgi:hypothetical protein